MSERVQASMLSASVYGLCSLLKVLGSEQRRQSSSGPWWSSSRCTASCCSIDGALARQSCWGCCTSCPRSVLGGDAQQELVPPWLIPPVSPRRCRASSHLVLLVLTAGDGGEGK